MRLVSLSDSCQIVLILNEIVNTGRFEYPGSTCTLGLSLQNPYHYKIPQLGPPPCVPPAGATTTSRWGQYCVWDHHQFLRGKGEGQEGGGSKGELGEGPGVADLQRCWGCHEGIRTTWKVGPWHTYFKRSSGAGVWSIQSGCDPWWRRVTGLKRRISANLA